MSLEQTYFIAWLQMVQHQRIGLIFNKQLFSCLRLQFISQEIKHLNKMVHYNNTPTFKKSNPTPQYKYDITKHLDYYYH